MRHAAAILLVAITLPSCTSSTSEQECISVLTGWRTPKGGQLQDVVPYLIQLRGDELRWNGMPVDERTFASYLVDLQSSVRANSGSEKTSVFVVLDAETKNCRLARRIRDQIDRHHPCREGMCGQGPADAFIQRVY